MEDTTNFGFAKVKTEEKEKLVKNVFDSVANRYDIMNDLMSLGIHRIWKRFAITACGLQPGHKVLDLAGGTGDLSSLIYPKIMPQGELTLSDINYSMLEIGRNKLVDQGYAKTSYVLANAENLPFEENHFDCIIIGFGLRNVTNKQEALNSMFKSIKPGGRLVILEFSKPQNDWFQSIYESYSFNVLPFLGKIVCNDSESYKYLAESIKLHPSQDKLIEMMEISGFSNSSYENLNNGIVAIHKGFKPC